MFFKRRRSMLKYFMALILGAALYSEWLVYVMQPLYWNKLSCQSENCTKILFIADPQIQGDLAVDPPLSYLYNWDSDRFLKSTFSVVVHNFQPDVLVFLGDLMDEGSIASMEQFHSYVKRLMHIFNVNYPIWQVWVPGDNDIGGEGEPIQKDKVEEFDNVFQQPDVIYIRDMAFYVVNKILGKNLDLSHEEQSKKYLKIAVSHYSLTIKTIFDEQVYKSIHPDIYFCAHEHISKYRNISTDFKDYSNMIVRPINYKDKVLKIKFDGTRLYEIFVPTCSYRMGTEHLGYGAAIVEHNNQQMSYTVFWSPKRFKYLYSYLYILGLSAIYYLIFWLTNSVLRAKWLPIRVRYNAPDRLPLLEIS